MHTSSQHYIHLVRYAVGNNMRNSCVLRCVMLVRCAVGDDASYADALR